MKVIKKADKKGANALDAQGYEFKLCGGSVEPRDRKDSKPAKKDAK